MSDFCLAKTDSQDFDLVFKDGDLVLSDSLQMSVILSVMSWCRDDTFSGSAIVKPCIGGWWADALNELPLGSKLWIMFRDKLTGAALEKAKGLVNDALKWMIDDGVAKSVSVAAQMSDNRNAAEFSIGVVKPDGVTEEIKFETNWEAS